MEMTKLIFISNRLPRKIKRSKGEIRYEQSVGGLATGLYSLASDMEVVWIGWPGVPKESLTVKQREKVREDFEKDGLIPISMSRREISDFYHGFCNRTIWPLFHYFTQYAEYHESQWEMYLTINRRFLESLKQIYEPGDRIWVHDYHLMALPRMIKEEYPDSVVGFFLHIPFPSHEVFRLFPWRREILEGLLGANLVGFHTYDYVTHFLNSVRRILGKEHDFGTISNGRTVCKVDAYPMGIDYDDFALGAQRSSVKEYIDEIKDKIGDRKIILSIDRLDYSKGIVNRLSSFDRFLTSNPEYIEKVTLILVAVPSRQKVDHYELLKKDLDEKVGQIEGKYGTIGWAPVWYMYRFLPFDQLLALYRTADVCMVTPLRDGMNLMAKEFIATKKDGRGVLILSEMAGAAHEMGEALIVNPNDFRSVSSAIKEALEMNETEQVERNRSMQRRLKRYDIKKWGSDFISDLLIAGEEMDKVTSRKIVPEIVNSIVGDFGKGKKRLIFLDYDGTLSEFRDRPADAFPDAELIDILERISSRKENHLIIISGRDRQTLDDWFGGMNITVSGEHGFWLKKKGGEWTLTRSFDNNWKSRVKDLLEVYTDRTPGSFIEEKDHSLVWHFRKTEPELGSLRSKQLTGDLLDILSNTDLGILEGNKNLEIKKIGVNKGSIVAKILEEGDYDFIMALGDDETDEDMFRAIPPEGLSIKVGFRKSNAKYNIESVGEVRDLLRRIMEK